MNMISGGYAAGPAVQRAPVLVIQEDRAFIEPPPEPRFILAMEYPFPASRQDSVVIALHGDEFVISLAAVTAKISELTATVARAVEAKAPRNAYGNEYPDASDFLSGLKDASGTFIGTFDLTEEEMADLGMPPAAKQVMNDARIATRVHPGNTLHIAPGSVSVSTA